MTLLGTTEGTQGANSGAGNQGAAGAGGGSTGGSGASGAAGGGQSGTAGGGAGNQTSGTSSPSWRDTLPEDIRGDATLGKYGDLPALARAHIALQGVVGKKGVFPPSQESPPEAWKSFWKDIGQPELDKFEVKLPEGTKISNKEAVDLFKKQAHELGLLPQQAQGVMNWLVEQESQGLKTRAEAGKAKLEEEHGALKREWGDGYDKQIAFAKQAVKEFGGEETLKYLNESGIGADVRIVKLLAKAGALLGEDKIRGEAGSAGFGNTPAEMQAELQKIMSHPGYVDSRHGEHKILTSRAEALFRKGAKIGA